VFVRRNGIEVHTMFKHALNGRLLWLAMQLLMNDAYKIIFILFFDLQRAQAL
jgi:hypothetical protein